MQKGIGLVCSFDTSQGAARFKSLISKNPILHLGCQGIEDSGRS